MNSPGASRHAWRDGKLFCALGVAPALGRGFLPEGLGFGAVGQVSRAEPGSCDKLDRLRLVAQVQKARVAEVGCVGGFTVAFSDPKIPD